MKNPSIIFLLIPIAFSFHSTFDKHKATSRGLLFQNALKEQKVQADITSNGGHNTNSVEIVLTNKTSSPMKITIPNGTVFIPDESGEQDLLLVEDELITLAPKQAKSVLLDAYCMESYDSSPDKGGEMTFKNVRPGSELKQLTTHLNGKKLKSSDIQSAVWAVSDGEPIEHISMNTPTADNLRETVSVLTGQENSWYTVNVNRRLDENRRIQTSSASISGKLKINLTKPAQVHEEVVDAEGNVKFTMKKASFTKAGEWNYAFRIRVMGWKVGDYKVLVFQDGVQIEEFGFTV